MIFLASVGALFFICLGVRAIVRANQVIEGAGRLLDQAHEERVSQYEIL